MEFEERFMRRFEEYRDYIITLNNVFRIFKRENEIEMDDFQRGSNKYVKNINRWGFSISDQFQHFSALYKGIKLWDSDLKYNKEEVEKNITQITNHTEDMLSNLPIILASMIKNSFPSLKLIVRNLKENESLFSDPASSIRDSLLEHNPLVVYKPDLSRQILLIYGIFDINREIKKKIRNISSTHLIVYVTKPTKESSEPGVFLIKVVSPIELKRSMTKLSKRLENFLSTNNRG